MTITTHRNSDTIDGIAEVERIHLKKLVEQMRGNIGNVSVLSDPDLELLSNMDPNHVADVTGKDFIEQLKEASGRLGGDRSDDGGFSIHLCYVSMSFFIFFSFLTIFLFIYFFIQSYTNLCS